MTSASTQRKFKTEDYIRKYADSNIRDAYADFFEHSATFPFSREAVWNWHARPGAVRRIMPDWEGIRPVEVGGITDGAVTEFRMKIGIVPSTLGCQTSQLHRGRTIL